MHTERKRQRAKRGKEQEEWTGSIESLSKVRLFPLPAFASPPPKTICFFFLPLPAHPQNHSLLWKIFLDGNSLGSQNQTHQPNFFFMWNKISSNLVLSHHHHPHRIPVHSTCGRTINPNVIPTTSKKNLYFIFYKEINIFSSFIKTPSLTFWNDWIMKVLLSILSSVQPHQIFYPDWRTTVKAD